MGFDLGSIHAAYASARSALKPLDEHSDGWLHKAAKAAAEWVRSDFERWCGREE